MNTSQYEVKKLNNGKFLVTNDKGNSGVMFKWLCDASVEMHRRNKAIPSYQQPVHKVVHRKPANKKKQRKVKYIMTDEKSGKRYRCFSLMQGRKYAEIKGFPCSFKKVA